MTTEQRLDAIEQRLAKIEKRLSNSSGADKIVFDKEHDRIIAAMETIRSTYSSHQTWSAEDRSRFNILRERRDSLRKLLGIKH